MAKQTFYRQCRLERKVPNGTCHQVSFIPEPYCKVGKVLKLRNSDGEWENGWVVLGAGDKRDGSLLPDPHQDIKGHRKATGDSLPKNK